MLFEDISFSVAEGQKIGLVAQNGTGKSTLLSILTGAEGYDSGDIIFRRDLRVGYLEQTPKFNPEDTVLDACFNHAGDDEKILKAKQILTQLKLGDLGQTMGTLSGGQQRRVALANVLITEPDMLVLDERDKRQKGSHIQILKNTIWWWQYLRMAARQARRTQAMIDGATDENL